MRLRTVAPALFLAAAIVLAACTDSDDRTPGPTATEPIVPTATVTLTPAPTGTATATAPSGDDRRTGDPALDAIVHAVADRDVGTLVGLMEMQTVGCTHAQGIGGPPKCEPHQAEGDQSTVFPLTSCEGEWSRSPGWLLGRAVHQAQGLYAALQAPDGWTIFEDAPETDTFLVFHADNMQRGFRLNVTDGRITSMTLGCSDEFAFHQDPRTGDAFSVVAGPWEDAVARTPEVPMTGRDPLDAFLEQVATYDFGALYEGASRAMQQTPAVPCVTQMEGPGGIECDTAKGETEGTPVQVFPSAYCEGSYARNPGIALQSFLGMAPVLHAVYEAPAAESSSPIYRNGEWWAVYEFTSPDAYPEAVRVHVTEAGEVAVMWYGCEGTLDSVSEGAGDEVEFALEG